MYNQFLRHLYGSLKNYHDVDKSKEEIEEDIYSALSAEGICNTSKVALVTSNIVKNLKNENEENKCQILDI